VDAQVEAAVAGGLRPQRVDASCSRASSRHVRRVLEFWIGDLDDDAFRAQSLYGSTALGAALASPAARPRLLVRLRTIERRLRGRRRPRRTASRA